MLITFPVNCFGQTWSGAIVDVLEGVCTSAAQGYFAVGNIAMNESCGRAYDGMRVTCNGMRVTCDGTRGACVGLRVICDG